MPSNLPAIIAGLTAAGQRVTRLVSILPYLPESIGDVPAHVFWLGSWQMIQPTYGEMAIEWTLPGYVLLPIGNAEATEAQLVQVLVDLIDEVGHTLTADGALADGQVLLSAGRRGTVTIARVPFHAQEVTYTVTERFPYTYA